MENAQPEPSMEEILASIRRIISDDETEVASPEPEGSDIPVPESTVQEPEMAAAAPPPAPDAQPQAPIEAAPDPDLVMEEESEMSVTEAAATAAADDDDILDQTAAEVATQAFKSLSQSVRVSEGPGVTLEDIVTEMLRPMIKEWLDANLPAIVEEKVENEVQRVARRRS